MAPKKLQKQETKSPYGLTTRTILLLACVALTVTFSFQLQGRDLSYYMATVVETKVIGQEEEEEQQPSKPLSSSIKTSTRILPASAKFHSHFCVPWDTHTDEWWAHHPDWLVDVHGENETHTCFQQLQDHPSKTKFLRTLHQHQFATNHCHQTTLLTSPPLQFALDERWTDPWHALVEGLAYVQEMANDRPLQLAQTNTDVPCPQRGTLECFFLPLSSCQTTNRTSTSNVILTSQERQELQHMMPKNNTLEYKWYLEYLIRPQSWLRKQTYEWVQTQEGTLPNVMTDRGFLFVDHGLEPVVPSDDNDLPPQIHVLSSPPIQVGDMPMNWVPLLGLSKDNNQVDAVSLMGVFGWMQRFPCEQFLRFEDSAAESSPFSDYLYWELVSALNRPASLSNSYYKLPFSQKIQVQRGNEAPLKFPQRVPIQAKASTASNHEDAATKSSTEPAEEAPNTSNKRRMPPYAKYDEQKQEYRLKLNAEAHINIINNTLCVPWTINGDFWWTHHRDWEQGPENETHYCFQKVLDKSKARYFKELYKIQFGRGGLVQGRHGANIHHCDKLFVKRMWNSGWGADLFNVVDGLHHAYQSAQPFQIQESQPWHYALPKRSVESALKPKSACPQNNMYCYLLNMTDCSSANHTAHKSDELLQETHGLYKDKRYRWYMEWIVRPQTWLRKSVYDYIQQQAPPIQTPCTAMHVRRNDVVLHNQQARKYHSISEYLQAAGDSIRPNILLMTDDHNAIGEATHLAPQYHWMFLDRPRFRGVGGWEHHIPSDEPVLEVVVLFALFQLIRNCDQFIMSEGKFSHYLYHEMVWNRNTEEREVDVIDIDRAQHYHRDVANAANYKTHVVSKNFDPEDSTADKTKKRLTSGGKRFVGGGGDPIPQTKEFEGIFCQPWNVDYDEWWTHHPTWEFGTDNETHYCFQPVADTKKAQMLQELYKVQFVEGNCANSFTKRMWSSGWGADFENLIDGLLHAIRSKNPVQVGKERWHYADPATKLTEEQQKKVVSNIACPKRSMFCFFLELSRCKPKFSMSTDWLEDPAKGMDEYPWLHEYATRQQTWLRKRVHDFVRKQQEDYFQGECAVMHVRRGDVVFHGSHARQYHSIQEYMEYAQNKSVALHKNILLLSDDQNAFAEAKSNFPEYNWMQIERPRKKAKDAKWEQHLASDDPIFEMVVILSIFKMVKQCDQFVHSTSNFAQHIQYAMDPSGKENLYLNIDAGKKGEDIMNPKNAATKDISKNFNGRR